MPNPLRQEFSVKVICQSCFSSRHKVHQLISSQLQLLTCSLKHIAELQLPVSCEYKLFQL